MAENSKPPSLAAMLASRNVAPRVEAESARASKPAARGGSPPPPARPSQDWGRASSVTRVEPNSASQREPVRAEDGQRVLVTIVCAPGSDMLEATHAFLTAYTAGRFRPLVAQRLSLAVYELLENALNYGSVTGDVVIELIQTRSQTLVRVENDAIKARIQMLNDHVGRILASPEGAFLEEVRRSVNGGIPRAMLGLARIAHEASLNLAVSITERRVSVTASCRD